jgi:neopullulanase
MMHLKLRKNCWVLCFFLLSSLAAQAQIKNLERIDPMFWWVGMKNPDLQLLVYGKDIAQREVKLKYEGVTLKKVHKVENPNYLFVDLEISPSAKAGSFELVFEKKGARALKYNYQLRERDASPDRIQGVTSADVIYFLMPDRFANGDYKNDVVKGMQEKVSDRQAPRGRHGGDIQGLMDKLDYLKDLGMTAIWCTPEIENDMDFASYHGYSVTDHYKIDPRYGTNELYKAYVEKAHSMGLKVIKDVVHNHCGIDHWFIKDIPSKDWVNFWPDFVQTNFKDQAVMDPYASEADRTRMLDGWFVETMPDLNHRNPFVQNYLNQNLIWWVEYAGIDGLRLDTYPYNDPQYMADWARGILAEFPNLSIFGETLVFGLINQAYFAQGDRISRGFDTYLPGITDVAVKDAIFETLNGEVKWNTGVTQLYSVLARDFVYKDPFQNVIFMDNHDMHRYYSVIGEDLGKYKAGLSILLTTRGIPQIYYGTEILMKNFCEPDPLVREDFPGGWKEDKVNKFTAEGRTDEENEAFDFLRTLANYRKNNPVLQTGKLMQYAAIEGIYVYFRYNEDKTVMVAVNTNEEDEDLKTDRFYERMDGFNKALNVLSGEKLDNLKTVKLPAKTTLVLELQK